MRTFDSNNKFIIFSDSHSVFKAMNHINFDSETFRECHDTSFQQINKLFSAAFLVK